jgi:hypothetical protein
MKKTKEFLIAIVMSLTIGFVIAVTMNGCNKPSNTAPIEPGNEFLTTPILILTDQSPPYHRDTLIWSEPPQQQTSPDTLRSFATLAQYHTYNVQILILDSTKVTNGVITDSVGFVVSNAIISRENYHLFCFYDSTNQNDQYGASIGSSRAPSGWVNVIVCCPNNDSNKSPLPFGITDQLSTYGPSKGQLEVVLRHQPAVKNGSCEPGSTDFDVYYNITVQ